MLQNQSVTLGYKNPGDVIYAIGHQTSDMGSSEYLTTVYNVEVSPVPYFSLEDEVMLHEAVRQLITSGIAASVHDVSDGGQAVALLESGFVSEYGFDIETIQAIRKDIFLFGEGQGRAVVSVSPAKQSQLEDVLAQKGIPFVRLGTVTGGDIRIDGESFGNIEKWRELYGNVLDTYLEN